MNCTASIKDGRAKLWAPTQSPNRLQQKVAELMKPLPEDVTVHVTLMGGASAAGSTTISGSRRRRSRPR
jgi:isoquinoline 1-oxidoreductase beta subunit